MIMNLPCDYGFRYIQWAQYIIGKILLVALDRLHDLIRNKPKDQYLVGIAVICITMLKIMRVNLYSNSELNPE